MKVTTTIILIILSFLALPSINYGQDDLAGDPSLVSSKEALEKLAAYEDGEYANTVEDFLSDPLQSNFKMSSNGNFLSFFQRDSLRNSQFMIQDTETGQLTPFTDINASSISQYFWATDTRILFVADKDGNELYHLYTIDKNGGAKKDLTPYDSTQVKILQELPSDNDHIIVAMNKDQKDLFEPYKININTGASEKLFENNLENEFITDYHFSKSGELRAYYTQDEQNDYILYYKNDSDIFERVLDLSFEEWFVILDFVDDESNPNLVYATSNLESDKRNIVLYDLKEKKALQTLFSHPKYDIDHIVSSISESEIDFYFFEGIKKQIIPISETYKKLHQKFEHYFKEQIYSLEGVSDDKTKFLLFTESDKIDGRYYLYNTNEDAFKLLTDLRPQLDINSLVNQSSFEFKNRDGITLEGYYYQPLKASATNKVPMVVIPHGGPYDLRDEWGFLDFAQLIASRGYCVLLINFRGSYGYGKKFQTAGYNQVGRKMLTDVEDGVLFMKKKDWIDGDRIAMYGGSYGGLTTLQSLIKTPELYQCGIDYCGPSNLFSLFESFPISWKEFIAYFHTTWYDPNDEAEAKIMKEVSPYFHLDQLNKPLFVVHGANDPRVKIQESDQIVSGLRARGLDVPYFVKYDEGHGFQKEESNIELNKLVLGFLAKHLKR